MHAPHGRHGNKPPGHGGAHEASLHGIEQHKSGVAAHQPSCRPLSPVRRCRRQDRLPWLVPPTASQCLYHPAGSDIFPFTPCPSLPSGPATARHSALPLLGPRYDCVPGLGFGLFCPHRSYLSTVHSKLQQQDKGTLKELASTRREKTRRHAQTNSARLP